MEKHILFTFIGSASNLPSDAVLHTTASTVNIEESTSPAIVIELSCVLISAVSILPVAALKAKNSVAPRTNAILLANTNGK